MVAVSKDLSLQIAIFRARLVARRDIRRAVEILVAAHVRLESAVRYIASLIATPVACAAR